MVAAILLFVGALMVGCLVYAFDYDRRRLRGPADPSRTDALEARMERLEGIVESTALEVERLVEGQRFLTKLLTDGRATPPSERTSVPPEA